MGDLKKIVAFPEYPNFKTTIQDQISYINSDFEFLLRAHIYRTRDIITRGLYIFYPIFSAVYDQERLILQIIKYINKEIWA